MRDRNTGDTTEDIILEYGSYAMHAKIGDTGGGLNSYSDEDASWESVKLDE